MALTRCFAVLFRQATFLQRLQQFLVGSEGTDTGADFLPGHFCCSRGDGWLVIALLLTLRGLLALNVFLLLKIILKVGNREASNQTYIINSLCGGRRWLLESISLPSSLSQQTVSLLRVLRCHHIHQQQQRDSSKHQTAMAIRIWAFSCIIRRDTRAPIVRKLCTVQYILACVGGDKQVLSKKIAFYATRARNVIRFGWISTGLSYEMRDEVGSDHVQAK